MRAKIRVTAARKRFLAAGIVLGDDAIRVGWKNFLLVKEKIVGSTHFSPSSVVIMRAPDGLRDPEDESSARGDRPRGGARNICVPYPLSVISRIVLIPDNMGFSREKEHVYVFVHARE